MKEIIIKNNKKEMYKNKLMTFVLAAVTLFLFGRNIFGGIKIIQPDFFNTEIEVTVSSAEVVEKTTYLTIKGNKTDSSDLTEETFLCADGALVLNAGETYRFVTVDGNQVYKITDSSNKVLLDQIEEVKKQGVTYIIFGAVVCAAVLVYVTITVISVAKKPAEERHDYVDYALGQQGNLTSRMLPKKCKTKKFLNIYNYIVAGLILALFVLILFVQKIANLDKSVQIIIYSSIGAVYVIAVAVLILIRPQFTSKHLTQYTADYLGYINDGPDCEYETAYIIQDDKLVYNTDKPHDYDLSKLNLYTVVLYKGGFYGYNIFLVSDMEELGQYDYDVIIPLTHRFYTSLKEKGLEVKNLDYVLEHLNELATKEANKPLKKVKVVRYND